MNIASTLVSRFPELKKHKPSADDIEVDVMVRPKSSEDDRFAKEEYKHLNAERKRLKLILESWNPDLVSTKARAKTEQELKRLTMRMRELRRGL